MEVDFIRKEIMRTGFPIEMEVFSILNARNWFANLHDYYFDFDLNVAREIDIRATPYPYKSAPNFSFYPFLAIECKKSDVNAWIFFKSKLKVGRFACAGQYADFLKSQNAERHFFLTFTMAEGVPHYGRSRLFSMSYAQVKLQKSGSHDRLKDEIFEAINQVIKYVSYEIESYLDSYRKGLLEPTSFVFFFPIIVFDGKLYAASFTKGGVSLKRVNHILLTTYYKPRYQARRVPFWIDIVTRKYFSTYLSIMEKEIDDLNTQIKKQKGISKIFLKELAPASKGSE